MQAVMLPGPGLRDRGPQLPGLALPLLRPGHREGQQHRRHQPVGPLHCRGRHRSSHHLLQKEDERHEEGHSEQIRVLQ